MEWANDLRARLPTHQGVEGVPIIKTNTKCLLLFRSCQVINLTNVSKNED